jgi:hypothetical protein
MSHGDAPGTVRGYRRHRRAGQDPCDECRATWNAYLRDLARRPATGPVDELAVAQAVAGHRMPLTRAEAGEAVRQLAGRGLNDTRIAVWLGVSTQTVLRHRMQNGIPAATPPGFATPPVGWRPGDATPAGATHPDRARARRATHLDRQEAS